jgi:small subunit ribosomal protein S16
MRLGKIRAPYYRIVVADSRTKRDGRVIETIGKYHPKSDPSYIEVDSERARYWLSVGAQPTDPVAAILKLTGDWQAHKGEAAPAEGVRTAAPRPDRKAAFEAAAKESLDKPDPPAKKAAKKAPAKKAAAAEQAADPEPAAAAEETAGGNVAGEAAADAPATEAPAAEVPTAEDGDADAPAAEASAEPAPAEAAADESDAAE